MQAVESASSKGSCWLYKDMITWELKDNVDLKLWQRTCTEPVFLGHGIKRDSPEPLKNTRLRRFEHLQCTSAVPEVAVSY